MQDRIIFREMLSEILALADNKGGRLTQEEVEAFFANAHLTGEQITMICEYLAGQKVEVIGFTPKEEPERVEEAGGLSEDEYMKFYLEEVEQVRPATVEEEETLFLLAAAGDQAARNRLAELNLGMVSEVAHTYAFGGLPVSDLIQEGNIALLMALDSLEIQEGGLPAWRQCLYQAVSEAMEAALAAQRDVHDMDEQIAERVNHLNEAVHNLERDLEHKVSVEELSAYLEMPVEEIRDILRMSGDKIELA